MVTDAQVRKLMEEMSKHGKVGLSALRAGMDRKTGAKYVSLNKLPSELKKPRRVPDAGKDTAPSKRLQHHIPGYQKVLHGAYATADAGLGTIRQRCPRFSTWIEEPELFVSTP